MGQLLLEQLSSLDKGEVLNQVFEEASFGFFLAFFDEEVSWNQLNEEEQLNTCSRIFQNLKLSHCNQALAKQYGFSKDDLSNIYFHSLYTAENYQTGLENGIRLFNDGFLDTTVDQINHLNERVVIKGTYQLLAKNNKTIGVYGIQHDVTEETLRNEKIEDYKKKLEIALDAEGEALWEWNLKTNSLNVSDNWFIMLGYAKNEFKATFEQWEKLIHPNDKESIQEHLQDYLSGKISRFYKEYRLKRKDGTFIWVLGYGKAVEFSTDNKPLKLIGTHSDITKIKEKELAAVKTKELLEIALNSGGQGIWEWDVPTDRFEFNQTWLDMVGIDKSIAKCAELSFWKKRIHADDIDLVSKKMAAHLAGETESFHSKHRVKTANGEFIWVYDSGKVVDYSLAGEPIKVIGTRVNLTPLIMAEERFQLALEGGNLGMWEYHSDAGKVYLHDSWLQMHGYGKEFKKSSYEAWKTIIHPDDLSFAIKKFQEYLDGEVPVFSAHYRIKNADGSYMWIYDQGRVIQKDSNGKPLVVIGTHLDIDVQRKHEIELQEMVLLRDKLMDILSHDLKSPVANITGLIDILKQSITQDQVCSENAQLIEMLSTSSKQLNEILTNMLIWSRVKGSRIEYIPEQFELSKLLKQSIANVASVAQSKEIQINVVEQAKDLKIITDKNLFHIMLNNILTNAIKFTPRAGEITITAHEKSECTRLTIADSGVGMSKDKLKTLFVAGKNKSTTGTEGEKGTGLGMLIVSEFMAIQNGSVQAESIPGKGTKIHLDFPVSMLN